VISVQEAESKILEQACPLGVETRPVLKALGLYLAEDVAAAAALPPFDNSAMDGYAVCSTDLDKATETDPVRLELVGEVAAGTVRKELLGAGQAVQIMTGAPMAPGADTVVILEEAKRRDGFLIVDHPVDGNCQDIFLSHFLGSYRNLSGKIQNAVGISVTVYPLIFRITKTPDNFAVIV